MYRFFFFVTINILFCGVAFAKEVSLFSDFLPLCRQGMIGKQFSHPASNSESNQEITSTYSGSRWRIGVNPGVAKYWGKFLKSGLDSHKNESKFAERFPDFTNSSYFIIDGFLLYRFSDFWSFKASVGWRNINLSTNVALVDINRTKYIDLGTEYTKSYIEQLEQRIKTTLGNISNKASESDANSTISKVLADLDQENSLINSTFFDKKLVDVNFALQTFPILLSLNYEFARLNNWHFFLESGCGCSVALPKSSFTVDPQKIVNDVMHNFVSAVLDKTGVQAETTKKDKMAKIKEQLKNTKVQGADQTFYGELSWQKQFLFTAIAALTARYDLGPVSIFTTAQGSWMQPISSLILGSHTSSIDLGTNVRNGYKIDIGHSNHIFSLGLNLGIAFSF